MTVTGQCRRTTQFIPTWCSLLDSLLLDATWCHLIPIAEGFPAVGALKLGIGQAENVESKNSARASGAGTGGTKQWWYIYIYICMYLCDYSYIYIYIYGTPPKIYVDISLGKGSTYIYIYKRVRFIFFSRGSFSRSIFPWGRGTRRCQTAAQTHSRTTSRRDTPAEIHPVFSCFLGRDICPENFFQSFCSILGFCWVCAACSSLLEMADGVEAIKEWPF